MHIEGGSGHQPDPWQTGEQHLYDENDEDEGGDGDDEDSGGENGEGEVDDARSLGDG